MTVRNSFYCLIIIGLFLLHLIGSTGCANIVPPGGGDRDSIPPVLMGASPKDSSINVTQQKITLTFNEFVELKNATEKILISPYPATQPQIEYKLRTVTVRLKDSLLPNTTYSIDFGNAVVDLNESNPLEGLQYVFSTGNSIDSNELSGRVVLAETGKADSTMFALLYTKQEDSTVAKDRPRYVARVDGKGNFSFKNLPTGKFYVYALLDMDGNKKYNQPIEQFAFLDSSVTVGSNTTPVTLFAFAAEKEKPRPASSGTGGQASQTKETIKQLRYTSNLTGGAQSLLDSLQLNYQKPIRKLNTADIKLLLDSTTEIKDLLIKNDSANKKIIIYTKWAPGKNYQLFLNKTYAEDTSGLKPVKDDTLSFRVKAEKEYGSFRIRFTNIDTAKHPVLLFYSNDQLVGSFPITGKELYRNLYNPGSYELGVLYDINRNGFWDAGDYFAKPKKQPEVVRQLSNKLTVKENWDNELMVDLGVTDKD
jgi:Bacterial Ig-like domain